MKKSTPGITREKYRIDFFRQYDTHDACLLAACMMSNKFIMRKTGLSNGQIYYRLKYYNIKRMDIRNGTSPLTRPLLSILQTQMETVVLRHIHKFGK